MTRFFLVVTTVFFLCGCTHFTEENLRRADTTIRFEHLVASPELYVGKTLILGGIVTANLDTPDGTALEIVELALSSDHVPEEEGASGGRFLATTPDFAETAAIRPGNIVSVIGEMKGMKTVLKEGAEQTYPILGIREIRIWNDIEDLPATRKSNYDPYYWGYPDYPHRDRPIGPVLKQR